MNRMYILKYSILSNFYAYKLLKFSTKNVKHSLKSYAQLIFDGFKLFQPLTVYALLYI